MDPVSAKTPRPTIRDVAKVAGVSNATVSRVLNGGPWVSEQARLAVEAAVQQTGYTTNYSARSLVTGRANSMAFLLTEEHQLLFSDPTFSILLKGAAAALAKRRMTMVLVIAGTPEERINVQRYLTSGHVDGVMLISSHEADPLVASLIKTAVPVVSCGLPLGHEDEVGSVAIDEITSASEMTTYLRRHGNRIAMIAGPADTPGGKLRLAGFKEAMGADFDPDLVVEGDFSMRSGTAVTKTLLGTGKQIDAIFAASDNMAIGAVRALHQAGLRVPDDVAVAGFDDSGAAEEHDPPLTTVRQPWAELSEAMVALLLEVGNGAPPRHVTLPTELIRRESA